MPSVILNQLSAAHQRATPAGCIYTSSPCTCAWHSSQYPNSNPSWPCSGSTALLRNWQSFFLLRPAAACNNSHLSTGISHQILTGHAAAAGQLVSSVMTRSLHQTKTAPNQNPLSCKGLPFPTQRPCLGHASASAKASGAPQKMWPSSDKAVLASLA